MSQPPIANNITANFVTSTKKDFYKNCLPGIKKPSKNQGMMQSLKENSHFLIEETVFIVLVHTKYQIVALHTTIDFAIVHHTSLCKKTQLHFNRILKTKQKLQCCTHRQIKKLQLFD